MVEKLDPEQLGVITFDTFVDEFYPGLFTASADNAVQPFTVYHYNGLKRSTLAKVIRNTVIHSVVSLLLIIIIIVIILVSHHG